jgi:hypothetical protein
MQAVYSGTWGITSPSKVTVVKIRLTKHVSKTFGVFAENRERSLGVRIVGTPFISSVTCLIPVVDVVPTFGVRLDANGGKVRVLAKNYNNKIEGSIFCSLGISTGCGIISIDDFSKERPIRTTRPIVWCEYERSDKCVSCPLI